LPIERTIVVVPYPVLATARNYSEFTQIYNGSQKSVQIGFLPFIPSYVTYYNGLPSLPVNAGSYNVTINLTDPRYTLESNSFIGLLLIEKASQIISYTPASTTAVGQTVALQASVSSGLPLTFAVTNGPGTLVGNQLTVTGPGTIFFNISQVGNGNYRSVSSEFTLNGACPSGQVPDQGTCKNVCTSFTYADFGVCSEQGQQTRTILSATPSGCVQGTPALTQSCTRQCTPDVQIGFCGETRNGTFTGTPFQCNSLGTAYFPNNTCALTCNTGFVKTNETTCAQITCTPGATTACASLDHASVTGYEQKCNALGTGFITTNGTIENTCVYRCDPRYYSNGTACIPGRTVFKKADLQLIRETVGLFVFPNVTNTSYLVFEETIDENRLANIALTIDQVDETKAYVLVHNVSLRADETKTIIVKAKRTSSNAVCIADKTSIYTRAELEENCFVLACPGINGSYACKKNNTLLIVTGLRHSGVIEERIFVPTTSTNTTTTSQQTTTSPTQQSGGTRLPEVATPGTSGSRNYADPLATGIAGNDAPVIFSDDNEEITFVTRLARIFAGGNLALLYVELGLFVLIVVLLLVILFAYSHFARQQS